MALQPSRDSLWVLVGHLWLSAWSLSLTCLVCSVPDRRKDAQPCPFKSHYMHSKMYICRIPLVMVINAEQELQVGARKRKAGDATVAEVYSVNKLTFRNICHWALISSFLFLFLKWINEE